MTTKLTAIIIGKKDIREADRLYTLYTREQGKMRVLGQGTRKLASKLSGNLELLNECTLTIARGKVLDRIATVDRVIHREPLKNDLEKLVCALYTCECIDALIKEGLSDQDFFLLFKDFLDALPLAPTLTAQCLTKIFSLKMMTHLGYQSAKKDLQPFLDTIGKACFADLLTVQLPSVVDGVIREFLYNELSQILESQIFFDRITGVQEIPFAEMHVRAL